MKWQSLLQAHRPTCPPLISDDHKLCFLAGLPLSIHIYSTQSCLLVSSLRLNDSQNLKSKLIKILRHPTAPQQLVILVSSTGSIYLFDFISNSIRATYDTGLLTSHAEIRPPLSPSAPSTNDSIPQSSAPFIIFLVTKKVSQPSTKPPAAQLKNPPRRLKTRPQSVIYAVKLEPLPLSQEKQDSINYPQQSIQKRTLLKVDRISTFKSSPCGNWLGVVTGLNLWIIRIKPLDLFNNVDNKKSKIESVHLSAPERITSIAFPPKAHADHGSSDPNQLSIVPCDFFATGSSSGKIALWHALSEAQWSRFAELTAQKPAIALPCPTSVSHWHSHAVADLTFTSNGSHLLSGGEEAVLVLWRLDDFGGIGLDSKTFLPRLGTQISSISLLQTFDELNQPTALVTGRDGIIMIVNVSSMSISKTLKLPRMYQLPPVYQTSTDPILLPISSESEQIESKKPYGNLLLQSSHPCGLQILDGGTGNVLDEIHVRPKNIVSRRGQRPIVEPKLLFVALGGVNDRYLATIDSWVDEERGFTPEITLKLWERDESSNRFQVIVRVDNPHDDNQITSLKLTTELVPKLITTSIDGTIKIWTSSSGTENNFNMVPNAITSVTTSLGKMKKSTQQVFENLKSKKLKFKNYGILKSRISKDNSILILLHRHPNLNIISIWDLLNTKFLNSFILDSPSMKLNSLKTINHLNQNLRPSKIKKFHVDDLEFLGDKNQFILVLGNFGCGLFDLLTGSEIGFWKCKPKFMIKTTDETKVVIIHEKRMEAQEESREKENKVEENHEKEKKKKKKKKETKNNKRSKVTMMAIVDVLERKSIMNHKIREVISGRFIPTNSRNRETDSTDTLTKDEILDGLVLVTKSAGLIRAGSEIKESDYYSITNRTLEIERQVGISSGLPFQEIFNYKRNNFNKNQVVNFDQKGRNFQQNDNHNENENRQGEINDEIEKITNTCSHLIPPSRFIWDQLIQPNRILNKPKININNHNQTSSNPNHQLQLDDTGITSINNNNNNNNDNVDVKEQSQLVTKNSTLFEFNRSLLASNLQLVAFQLLDSD